MKKISISNGVVCVRTTEPGDFLAMQDLCKRVYPFSVPWKTEQLASHLEIFQAGQLVAVEESSGSIIGMASSLIVCWDDYDLTTTWSDFTDQGYFTNHDPKDGRTLYGAEVMVDANYRGKGVGKLLYKGREEIVNNHNLLRIRAGARMRGYATYHKDMSPREYLVKVGHFQLYDPTISFQLKRGFKILDCVQGYLRNDPESLGYAAVIEWLNPKVATDADWEKQKNEFN